MLLWAHKRTRLLPVSPPSPPLWPWPKSRRLFFGRRSIAASKGAPSHAPPHHIKASPCPRHDSACMHRSGLLRRPPLSSRPHSNLCPLHEARRSRLTLHSPLFSLVRPPYTRQHAQLATFAPIWPVPPLPPPRSAAIAVVIAAAAAAAAGGGPWPPPGPTLGYHRGHHRSAGGRVHAINRSIDHQVSWRLGGLTALRPGRGGVQQLKRHPGTRLLTSHPFSTTPFCAQSGCWSGRHTRPHQTMLPASTDLHYQ
jgi:hypothetical protein